MTPEQFTKANGVNSKIKQLNETLTNLRQVDAGDFAVAIHAKNLRAGASFFVPMSDTDRKYFLDAAKGKVNKEIAELEKELSEI